MTVIVSTSVRHRVRFAPNPANPAFPTKPVIVETRLVSDVTEYPPKVDYISFDDVVETVLRLPNGKEKTVYSEPVNDELYHVVWDEEKRNRMKQNGLSSDHDVEVHPSLVGKIWVVTPR